jgi:glycerol uptake facilitator-like aquaporin
VTDSLIVPPTSLSRRLVAEGAGTALLLVAVVGSGIMGETLAGGNVAIALLANSLATGAALVALIVTFGPISGAHFNPAVSIAEVAQRRLPLKSLAWYLAAQVAGALGGVAVAHLMFELPVYSASLHDRSGPAQVLSEFVATFGLVAAVSSASRMRSPSAPFAIAGYIVGAYWFTASTCFANPAVTLARATTATFSGIRLADVPWFVAAQVAGALAASVVMSWLLPRDEQDDAPLHRVSVDLPDRIGP